MFVRVTSPAVSRTNFHCACARCYALRGLANSSFVGSFSFLIIRNALGTFVFKELQRKIEFCSCRLHVQWGYFCYEAYHVSVADPGFEQWGVDGREFVCAFVARKNFADHRHIGAFLLHFNSYTDSLFKYNGLLK